MFVNESNIRRLKYLLNRYDLYQTYSVAIDELEDILSSSRRNISNIMKNLSELDWIEWIPAVGRSNTNKLLIKCSLQQAISQSIRSELSQGRFTLITKLLKTYGLVTVKALAEATELQNQLNELNNQLLIAEYPWIDELDPVKTFRSAELQIIKSIYDTLIKQDHEGNLEANIAHTWEAVDNEFTFWIRSDISRHDGLILSIEDVINSLKSLCNSKGPFEYMFQQVISITKLSSQSFKIILKSVNPLFLYVLSMPNASIVIRDKMKSEMERHAYIGTGPFRVQFWSSEVLTLQRHQSYFSQKALLQRITLSTQGQDVVDQMSFNQHDGVIETHFINAFSYLSLRYRDNAGVSKNTLEQLAYYINREKSYVESMVAVNGVSFQHADKLPCEVPILNGEIVLAEPVWTIPYLKDVSEWLHQTIRSTGLDLKLVTLQNISDPSSVSHLADVLFIENLIEEPVEYGIYEWLLTASGLCFAFTPADFELHLIEIERAVSLTSSLQALLKVERNLYDDFYCIPLFWGKEEITRTQQVQGIQVRKTGYSDFDKLWISKPG